MPIFKLSAEQAGIIDKCAGCLVQTIGKIAPTYNYALHIKQKLRQAALHHRSVFFFIVDIG